jgi:hypothetical protein
MVSEQYPILLFVVELDAAEIVFLSLPCLLVKANHLVAGDTDVSGSRNRRTKALSERCRRECKASEGSKLSKNLVFLSTR